MSRPQRIFVALRQDFRHGLRLIGRAPGLALAACASVAIGVGGTTAAFALVDAALIRPWPYPDADRLVVLGTDLSRYFSMPAFRHLAGASHSVDHLTAAQAQDFVVTFDGQAVLIKGHRVTAEATSLFGLNGRLRPAHGRPFLDSEFGVSSEPVLAISYRLWVSRFGSSPEIVGTTLMSDGRPHRIVAVLSPQFDFFPDSEILAPLSFAGPRAHDEFARTLELFGSLRQGATLTSATWLTHVSHPRFAPDPDRNGRSGARPRLPRVRPDREDPVADLAGHPGRVLPELRDVDGHQIRRSSPGAGRTHRARRWARAHRAAARDRSLGAVVIGGALGVVLAYVGRGVVAGNAISSLFTPTSGPDWRVILFATLMATAVGVLLQPRAGATSNRRTRSRLHAEGRPGSQYARAHGSSRTRARTGSQALPRSHLRWSCSLAAA